MRLTCVSKFKQNVLFSANRSSHLRKSTLIVRLVTLAGALLFVALLWALLVLQPNHRPNVLVVDLPSASQRQHLEPQCDVHRIFIGFESGDTETPVMWFGDQRIELNEIAAIVEDNLRWRCFYDYGCYDDLVLVIDRRVPMAVVKALTLELRKAGRLKVMYATR